MELIHSKLIFSDIESLVQEIRTYFNDLDSENIRSEMYASRIAKELTARIENVNGVIQTTLLTYLDKDARKEISGWEPVDQNRYYDEKIREKISKKISSQIHEEEPFSPKTWSKKYVQITSGVIAIGGFYYTVSSPAYLASGVFILGVLVVILAAGVFFLVPHVVDKYNKKKTLEQLGIYLDEIKKGYNEQARKIIDEYISLFEEIKK